MKELYKMNRNSVRRLAFEKRAKDYTGTDSRFGQILETFRPHFEYHGVGRLAQSAGGFVFNDLMMLGFKPWLWFGKHPLSTGYKVEQFYRSLTENQEDGNMIGGMLGWGSQQFMIPDYENLQVDQATGQQVPGQILFAGQGSDHLHIPSGVYPQYFVFTENIQIILILCHHKSITVQ